MDSKRTRYINGCVLIAGGVLLCIIIWNRSIPVIFALGLLLSIYGLAGVLLFCAGRANGLRETAASLVGGLFTLLLGLFLIISANVTMIILEKAMSVWLVVTGLIYLLIAYTYKIGKERGWVFMLAASLLATGFGIVLWSNLTLWNIVIGVVIPAYLVALGLHHLIDWSALAGNAGVHFALPMLLQAFLPQKTLAASERANFAVNRQAGKKTAVFVAGTLNGARDVEVLVHMSDRLAHSFGHVDIAFGGHVFSYGNYDHSKEGTHLPLLLYDGVFFICPRRPYLDYLLTKGGKTIFGYQLGLDCEQKELVEGNIERFLRYCMPWSPGRRDRKVNAYVWTLEEMGARLYKTTEGRFRTYFVLNSNCALLSEVLLEGIGLPRARSIGGLVTPGSVLSMYERELAKKGGVVVSKKEYVGSEQAGKRYFT